MGLRIQTLSATLLAAATVAGTAAPGQTGRNMRPAPIGNPADWFSPEDYPPDALRTNRSGRTVVQVGVDSTGQVVTCNVEVSSGTDSLDRRTCEVARERGHFNPGTDRKGRPTAGEYSMPIRWELPEQPWMKDGAIELSRLPATQTTVTRTIHVDPDGVVTACQGSATAEPKTAPAVDPCAGTPVGKAVPVRYLRDGKPVGATLVETHVQKLTPDP